MPAPLDPNVIGSWVGGVAFAAAAYVIGKMRSRTAKSDKAEEIEGAARIALTDQVDQSHKDTLSAKDDVIHSQAGTIDEYRKLYASERDLHEQHRKEWHDKANVAQGIVDRLTAENMRLADRTDLQPVLEHLAKSGEVLAGIAKAQSDVSENQKHIAKLLQRAVERLFPEDQHPAPH